MTRVLPFPAPASFALARRDDILGRWLLAIRQTPWMAPVCIQDADGMRYECRIVLELEPDIRVELLFDRLILWPGRESLEQVRHNEHQWHTEITPLGHTVAAVGRNKDGQIRVLTDNGAEISLERPRTGPLRVDQLDLTDPETAKKALAQLTDPWTETPLVTL